MRNVLTKALSLLPKNEELLVRNDRFCNINKTNRKAQKLKVLTWNFSYGHGIGSASSDFEKQDEGHYQNALKKGSRLITDLKPDLVFLQEVDFHCAKTYFTDQVQFLGAHNNLNYAYGTSWDCVYVPYPVLKPSSHFGKTLSGSGVLSKYPILSNKIYLFEKPKENYKVYNFFYPYRYLQITQILINGQKFTVGNLHLEAFKKEARYEQMKKVMTLLKKEKVDLFCGDFNTIPDWASNNDFGPDAKEDYIGDKTFKLLHASDTYNEVVTKDEYIEDEASYFTFPSDNEDRRLDYIFYRKSLLSKVDSRVIKNVKVSDHFPVFSTLEFKS